MLVFFDCEFTGLQKNTTLISIGLITEDNRKFYAEFNDYEKGQVDGWIRDNVIPHLIVTKAEYYTKRQRQMYIPPYFVYGGKQHIAKRLQEWLESLGEDIQLVSDVCHYDMMLFCDIFGHAFNIPKCVNPVCHDINQDIAEFYKISEKEAFDMSREEIANMQGEEVEKHNALYDAIVIRKIYEKIKGVK